MRRLSVVDRPWVQAFLERHWGPPGIICRGHCRTAADLDGFMVETVALATFVVDGPDCELVTLNSERPGQGLGSALLAAVVDHARAVGCPRVWLITTNDNLDALGFYQRRGFRLVAVYPDALEATRRFKPTLPAMGAHGIPLRDELELERLRGA